MPCVRDCASPRLVGRPLTRLGQMIRFKGARPLSIEPGAGMKAEGRGKRNGNGAHCRIGAAYWRMRQGTGGAPLRLGLELALGLGGGMVYRHEPFIVYGHRL